MGRTATSGWADGGVPPPQLPHNHIVRTVDLNAAATHVLSGGHEKRLRIWDFAKVDPDGTANDRDALEFKLAGGAARAHDGTIKSAVWDERRNAVVSMGEDKVIRCVCVGWRGRRLRGARGPGG